MHMYISLPSYLYHIEILFVVISLQKLIAKKKICSSLGTLLNNLISSGCAQHLKTFTQFFLNVFV